ncbi:MAG: hypothetical protein WBX25_36435 [Rhodomicrobium sp.]
MEFTPRVELALQNDTEYRSVGLELDSNGAIKIDAHDMGPTVKQIWDHDDYEFSVTVPATAVARLAFELLKEKFAGNVGAVDALRSFCLERSIEHEFFSWP